MLDVVVIGAGPAGGSAALFVAKASMKVVVIDNDQGLTRRAWMENHYGAKSISGPELLEIGKGQAEGFGAEFIADKAILIERTEESLVVKTEQGQAYEAKQVIIASGFGLDLVSASGIHTAEGREPKVKTIIAVDSDGRTSMPGVWAAGVCAGVSMHTIITAGDGAKVAVNVISELKGERYVDHDVKN